MSTKQRVYRAHVNFNDRGAVVWCHFGTLSACGEWVELGDTRWRHTSDDWFATEAEAKAAKSDEVRRMGQKLIEQAQELLAAEVQSR